MSKDIFHKPHQALMAAFWLNACFAVIEIGGSIYTNSTAILTDAVHDLGDTLAIGLGIVFEKIAKKEPTPRYTFGYKRFSLLSALLLSIILILSAMVMVFNAIETIINPQFVNSQGMWWLAVLGIAVNGLAFLRVKQSGKNNHVEHNHHNQNSKAIMLHFLEDVLGWVAVLVGSAIIYYTHWFWIDGLLSICIATYIGFNAIRNLIYTMRIFLQVAPESIDTVKLKDAILNIDGVISINEFRIWLLDENEIVCTFNLLVHKQKADSLPVVKEKVINTLKNYSIFSSTIQIEEV